jgi:hypothetical protein
LAPRSGLAARRSAAHLLDRRLHGRHRSRGSALPEGSARLDSSRTAGARDLHRRLAKPRSGSLGAHSGTRLEDIWQDAAPCPFLPLAIVHKGIERRCPVVWALPRDRCILLDLLGLARFSAGHGRGLGPVGYYPIYPGTGILYVFARGKFRDPFNCAARRHRATSRHHADHHPTFVAIGHRIPGDFRDCLMVSIPAADEFLLEGLHHGPGECDVA